MLFSVMFQDQLVPTAQEIASAYEAVDNKLQKQTDFAASSLIQMLRAKEEAVQLREENVPLKKRVSELEGPSDNQRKKSDS